MFKISKSFASSFVVCFWVLLKKEEKDCDICGVEIADGAAAVNEHPFKRNTAFLLGNEVIKSKDQIFSLNFHL